MNHFKPFIAALLLITPALGNSLNKLYVVNTGSSNVAVIDADAGTTITTISNGAISLLQNIVKTPGDAKIYFTKQ